MDRSESPTGCVDLPTSFRSSRADPASAQEASAILDRLEECLAGLDLLGWTLPAAHLSLAVESLRDSVASTRLQMDAAERLLR